MHVPVELADDAGRALSELGGASVNGLIISCLVVLFLLVMLGVIHGVIISPEGLHAGRVAPAPAPKTEAEEALLAKLRAIKDRVHGRTRGEEPKTPLASWQAQLTEALAEVDAAPASDEGDDAFSSRRHLLKDLAPLVAVLTADLEGFSID